MREVRCYERLREALPPVAVVTLLVLTAGVARPQEMSWDVVRVPGVDTDYGRLENHFRGELNDAGQVAVTLYDPATGHSVAVRFRADTGEVEVIDPDGYARTLGWQINERGQIFGYRLNEAPPTRQIGVFLDTPGEGPDLLEESGRRVIWANFDAWDLTDRGEVTGGTSYRRQRYGRAFLYSKELGWTELTPLDPLLSGPGAYSVARTINARGDILFTVAHPGAISPSYLWHDDHLIDLNRKGFNLSSPTRVSDEGYVPSVVANNTTQRAYAFSTQTGRRYNLHLPRFRHSFAQFVTPEGVFAVAASRGSFLYMDTIYMFDIRGLPGSRTKIRVRREDFEPWLEDGVIFRELVLTDMNDRQEMAVVVRGERKTASGDVTTVRMPCYVSPSGEVWPLRTAFEEAGLGVVMDNAIDINRQGQILVEAGPRTVPWRNLYVLTPRR